MEHCQKTLKATALPHAFSTGKEHKSTDITPTTWRLIIFFFKLVKWEETRVLPANMVNALDLTVSQIGNAPDFIQWKLKLCE